MPNVEEAITAPCGCWFGSIDDAFVIEPCSLLCPLYLYALEEGKKQGKQFDVRVQS